jgi:hypothetical protein
MTGQECQARSNSHDSRILSTRVRFAWACPGEPAELLAPDFSDREPGSRLVRPAHDLAVPGLPGPEVSGLARRLGFLPLAPVIMRAAEQRCHSDRDDKEVTILTRAGHREDGAGLSVDLATVAHIHDEDD